MTTETTYNGWTNRETWAVALWLNNDEGMYSEARDLVGNAPDNMREQAEAIENLVDEYLDADVMPWEGQKSMRDDIGSLWRVDWYEVAASFIDED